MGSPYGKGGKGKGGGKGASKGGKGGGKGKGTPSYGKGGGKGYYTQPEKPVMTWKRQRTDDKDALPVLRHKESILSALDTEGVLVISGDTGCGKSTQVPQFLLDADPNNKIVVTQPRRLAARALAERVSNERGSVIGRTVGYALSRDRVTTLGTTRLTFMTTGLLLQLVVFRPADVFSAFTHIVIDEAHERDVDLDLLLLLLRRAMRGQAGGVPPMSALHRMPAAGPSSGGGKEKAAQVAEGSQLRLIVMSATIDSASFTGYFSGCCLAKPTALAACADTADGTPQLATSVEKADTADGTPQLATSVEEADTADGTPRLPTLVEEATVLAACADTADSTPQLAAAAANAETTDGAVETSGVRTAGEAPSRMVGARCFEVKAYGLGELQEQLSKLSQPSLSPEASGAAISPSNGPDGPGGAAKLHPQLYTYCEFLLRMLVDGVLLSSLTEVPDGVAASGSVLIFLPGYAEIQECLKTLQRGVLAEAPLLLLPLHSLQEGGATRYSLLTTDYLLLTTIDSLALTTHSCFFTSRRKTVADYLLLTTDY